MPFTSTAHTLYAIVMLGLNVFITTLVGIFTILSVLYFALLVGHTYNIKVRPCCYVEVESRQRKVMALATLLHPGLSVLLRWPGFYWLSLSLGWCFVVSAVGLMAVVAAFWVALSMFEPARRVTEVHKTRSAGRRKRERRD